MLSDDDIVTALSDVLPLDESLEAYPGTWQEAPYADRDGRAVLGLGDHSWDVLLDRDTTSAGRHPDSDIFLDDVTVSRRHAEFRRDGAEFVVVDVGSLNGTYVNRDRIDSVELNDADEVQIGKYRLVFFSSHPAS